MKKGNIDPDWDPWFFDCDGVLLASNELKTDAFRKIGAEFGQECADALVKYHVQHGGISRFHKIRHFVRVILQKQDLDGQELQELEGRLLSRYAELVQQGYLSVDVVPGFEVLMHHLRRNLKRNVFVVSGSAQDELRQVFRQRGFDSLVDGIYGSPATKPSIVRQLLQQYDDQPHGVFVGDSRADWLTAQEVGIEFVFVNGWTEWDGWRDELPVETPVYQDLSTIYSQLRDYPEFLA